jgi:hypothetical protein
VNSQKKGERMKEEKSFMHRVKLLNKHIYISAKNRSRKECEKKGRKKERKEEISKQNVEEKKRKRRVQL